MGITSKFTTAIHALLLIYFYSDKTRVTSSFIAQSVNTNPVVIRRILLQLKKAGLIIVLPGKKGSRLLKKPEQISLLDIYKAVENIGSLFNLHENPNPSCPIGRNIHGILDIHLRAAQNAMEQSLAGISLKDLIDQINKKEKLL